MRMTSARFALKLPPNGGAPAPDPTYLPLLGFLTFDRESEQYLCAALLRHGKAVASEGTVGLLSRLLPLLRVSRR